MGQTVSTLANLGVIAGIAFVAVEVSQNNSEMAAQGRNPIYQMQSELQRDFVNNAGGIADIWSKPIQVEDLTFTERVRMGSYGIHLIRTFEYMCREDRQGALQSVRFMANVFSLPAIQEM